VPAPLTLKGGKNMHDKERNYVENQRQMGGEYRKWNKLDILTPMNSMMHQGYHINAETGMICIKRAHGFQTPWVHVVQTPTKRCGIDHQIKFEKFGFIPPRCLQCWKVVVMPRTLKELFQLEQVEYVLQRPSKCGIEVRNYTPRHYGGYFYNDSVEEGRECYEVVREAVNDMISPEVGVILKRGCTEMEMKCGNAGFWHITPEHLELDQIIEDRVENSAAISSKQADYVVAHVKNEWMKWAFSHGDMTYKEFNGGMNMFPDYQYFHEGDINQIKEELALAQAMGSNIDPEVTKNFRILTGKFMEDNNLNAKQIGAMVGMYEKNYFEPMAIGGQDETT